MGLGGKTGRPSGGFYVKRHVSKFEEKGNPIKKFWDNHKGRPVSEWTDEDIQRFEEILDNSDDLNDAEMSVMRSLIDAKGILDDVYQKNFQSGVVELLERSRKVIGCETVEQAVIYLYSIGYSFHRICYQLYAMGFRNITGRVVSGVIAKKRFIVQQKRREFMSNLAVLENGLWQQAQARYIESESVLMEKLFRDLKELTDRFESLSPLDDKEEYNDILRSIEDLHNRVNKMNGVDAVRKLSLRIAEKRAELEARRSTEQGFDDKRLNRIASNLDQKSRDAARDAGETVDAEVEMIDQE